VTDEMVAGLESVIDDVESRFEQPTDFVVPGETVVAAQLDVARTVVRRAERVSIGIAPVHPPVIAYLNRLSDLLWTLARWQEETSLLTKDHQP
jgi:cob(I)alamin adenosyltransferase